MVLRRVPLSSLAVAVLLVGGVGLAVLAVQSIFRTTATEIAPQVQAPPSGVRIGPEAGAIAPPIEVPAYAATGSPAGPAGGSPAGPAGGSPAGPAGGSPAGPAGGSLRLDAFRGHPIVLNFWASWCPPCRAETKALEAAYLRYKARGVVIIGIDGQTDTWGASRDFLHQQGVTYPVGRDVRGAAARAYRVGALPTTYFIGADGRVEGPAVTGGFTGQDGAKDLAAGIEKMLR